ncbi:Small-conductance mechanosensitive channel [Pirellulimonas nuda]|uniref:Small-conductance mechanosensitive channel n=1 Tax=Pirellulimonas nuda TaxID=2528009 RepID=A0A518DJ54_9BACT|nr:mechanosensitive ion channel family protein [Pirellulimonas nuda]QDU91462.1 Small-conductance mechanosensitive channel [Pirellulimonas nuda]
MTTPLAELDPELTKKLYELDFQQITRDQWIQIAVEYGMRIALVLIILFLAFTLAGWVAAAVRTSLTRMRFDPTLSKFLAKLASWMVLLLAALSCMGYFGIETTSFAALIGAAGLAIGLAFQGTLSNFASGAMLLVFRPFKVGDVVNIASYVGKVDEIELFTTTIDTFDNRRIIVPNNSIFGAVIENITYHTKRRVDVPVGVAYCCDIDQTRSALESAARTTPGGLADPAPEVVLDSLGDSSVNWVVRVWAPTKDFLAVKQATIRAAKRALDEAGLEIPFPQMDLHLRSMPQEASKQQ